MKKPIERGYYGGIFFEFILQDRTADAVIILPGFPSGNDFSDIAKVFFERGYHVFVPRYRGSYQSSGVFLSRNPVDDMVSFVQHLEKEEAKSLWDGKKVSFKINKKVLVGCNFGGPIACALAAKYPVFSHLILAAPIWDFRKHNEDGHERDLEKMADFVKSAYKNCYRFKFKGFTRKMRKFEELYPEFYMPGLKLPVLVMHDPNDHVVAFKHTQEKLQELKKPTYLEHYFGHKLSGDLLNAFWKDIDKFVKINYIITEQQKKREEKEKALAKLEEEKERLIKEMEKEGLVGDKSSAEKPAEEKNDKAEVKEEAEKAGEKIDKKVIEDIKKEVEKLNK